MKLLQVCLAALLEIGGTSLAAEGPTFDQLYQGVSDCRFDLSRYNDVPMAPYAEAVLISLPMAGARRGILITTFYFSPAKGEQGENYGLVFNASLDVISEMFPELVGRRTVNGYLRRLSRLSDETGDRKGVNRTLLSCSGGTQT